MTLKYLIQRTKFPKSTSRISRKEITTIHLKKTMKISPQKGNYNVPQKGHTHLSPNKGNMFPKEQPVCPPIRATHLSPNKGKLLVPQKGQLECP